MIDSWMEVYGDLIGEINVNLGCALNKEITTGRHKWINVDMNPDVAPDLIHDICNPPIPLPDKSVDFILGSHIFEHVPKDKFLEVAADMHRILVPGGHLLSVTPYGTSNDSWENPMHLMDFTEFTWAYVCDAIYKVKDNHGTGATQGRPVSDWKIVNTTFVPNPEFANDPEIEFKRKHWNNVIKEIHVVLRRGNDG